MKNITKSFTSRLVSAVMALLLIFTVFASFGAIKAQAAIGYVPAPEGDGITDVYYLFDYYPEVGNTKMAQEYPHVDIVYDRNADIQTTLSMIAVGAYSPINELPEGCTVVIDVKTYKPDSALLANVFAYIKESLYCKTIFVTVYNELDFSDDDPDESFFDYLDKFYTSDDVRLEAFCNFSSRDAKAPREPEDETIERTLNDTCILIDGNIVNSNSLFGNYSFLRILLEQLWIAVDPTNHTPNTAYLAMINHLKQEHNVSFLVHTTGNSFKDLATNVTYTASNGNYPEAIDGGEYGDLNYSNIYAIGFFQLSNDFYDYLYATQQVRGITVYLLEADPFTYSEDGLDVITDYELEQMYNEGYYELDTFMNELMELV